MCPDGWTKKTSGPYVNTINDCESCAAGAVCSSTSTVTLCPDGYNCEAMTTDVSSKPGQPGEYLTRDSAGVNNDIAACASGSNNYCEGASWSGNIKTCPAGYTNNYSGDSAASQYSEAGCYPVASGSYSSAATACTAGKMCPTGSSAADINIPAGYFHASTSRGSLNDVTVCPANSWCAAGSTDSTTTCDAGYYCGAGTVFQYDTPCSFGKTSSAGTGAIGSCSACTDG
jgi:hypothetical protein